jgi:histidinol-phosphatase (PHP family)
MLTDYHLHLRPDDTGKAGDYFTDENVDRYLTAAEEHGIDELGVSEHLYRFTEALEVWNHPYWEGQARDDLDTYADFVRGTPLKLGIECDFVPGSEDRIANLLERDFDYVVGSIHFLGTRGAVDDRRYDVWEEISDPDELWSTYFRWQAELAHSGLFDIVSHPDLVKIWGDERSRPQRDPRFHYEPFVEAVSESGIAVEVSTAGLRTPVREIYPARALAQMCVEAGADFALSSDAHAPDQVGFGYDRALELLSDLGVERICVFDARERRLEPLGRPGDGAGQVSSSGEEGA